MQSLTKILVALSLASTEAIFGTTFCSPWDEAADKCECQTLPGEIAEAYPNYPGTPLQTTTQWAVQPEQILSYPCSKGYLNNGEANYELEKDIQHAITELGHDLIDSVNCGLKCDIDNGAVAAGNGNSLDESIYEPYNANSILKVKYFGWLPIYKPEELKYLCGQNPGYEPRTGALDKWWADKGFKALSDGLSACDCKKGVTNANGETFDIATGCYRCAGTVAYGITASTGCYVSDPVSKFDAI